MEKMKMETSNITNANVEKIRELFPGCVTEGENGATQVVNFDLLKQELSNHIVEGPQERYQLDWPGKRKSLVAANTPINKTLRPSREESVDYDTTKNLFIEGDNLDALKLLQETYLGKVKMIYIDPPYNTGKDFVYKDNFNKNKVKYDEISGNKDADGGHLVTNTDSNGRYHSDWMSMIYPRLKLARNLLRDDGVIFISIDDGEVGNLRELADQVFGENNFIANVIWQKKYTRANDAKWFSDNHDHILCYGRNKSGMVLNMLPRNSDQLAAYSNPDNHPKGAWKATPLHAKSGTNNISYTFDNGVIWSPPVGTYRRFNDASMKRMDEGDEIWFGSDGQQTPSRKSFLRDVKNGVTPVTLWPYDEVGHNHEANSELKSLGIGGVFDNPKPVRLIYSELILATRPDDIVIDFFAGSSTTAHAVMKLNAEDGGNRKFIMIQIPEVTDEKSEAHMEGYKTIAEIGKERIRRAGAKIKEGECHENWNQDTGFRVLKVDSSNLKSVYYTPDQTNQSDLVDHANNIKDDRSDEDLLFQVLLDWGVDLTLTIERRTINEKTVYFVDDDTLAACFEDDINEEFVKELAKEQPLRVVFRDAGFSSSSVKINVEQIFKHLSPHTEVKVI